MNILAAAAFIALPVIVVAAGVILKARFDTSEMLKKAHVQLPLPNPDSKHDVQMQHTR